MRLTLAFLVAVASITASFAAYTDKHPTENNVGHNPGYPYGYGPAGTFPQPYFFPYQMPHFDFNNLLQGYFQAMQKYNQYVNDNLNQIQAQVQQAASSGYGVPGGFAATGGYGNGHNHGHGGGFAGSFGAQPAGYGAGASASIGPGGGHQTAKLNPENPASPNVNTRFGAGGAPAGGGGYRGVFVSSSSSNIDGKATRTATTSVNDNGKVTTYTVRD